LNYSFIVYCSQTLTCFSSFAVYGVISALCITSFIRVSTMNPGALSPNLQPQGWFHAVQWVRAVLRILHSLFLTKLAHISLCPSFIGYII